MKTLAVTGGIATGKSSVVRALAARFGPSARIFDCDACVAELLTTSEITARITETFGKSVLSPSGGPDRRLLREIVFHDSSKRRKLEELLHPPVLRRCQEEQIAAETRLPRPAFFVVDVPLLYEVDFPINHHMAICTGCSPKTQLSRLRSRSSLDERTALAMIHSQLSQQEKFSRANIVVWTEGSHASVERQIDLIATQLKKESLTE